MNETEHHLTAEQEAALNKATEAARQAIIEATQDLLDFANRYFSPVVAAAVAGRMSYIAGQVQANAEMTCSAGVGGNTKFARDLCRKTFDLGWRDAHDQAKWVSDTAGANASGSDLLQ